MSQFDDLLGDFGESPATKTTNNGDLQDFDPFGAPAMSSSNGAEVGAGDSDMLLDFGVSSETNGGSITVTTNQSANPLYDAFEEDEASTATTQSANPLYDDFLSSEPAELDAANPLYQEQEFEPTPVGDMAEEQASNPLYEEGQLDDFPSDQQQEDYSSDQQQQEDYPSDQQQQEELVEEGEPQMIDIEPLPPQIMNGHPKDWVPGYNEPQEELEQQEEIIEDEQEKAVDVTTKETHTVVAADKGPATEHSEVKRDEIKSKQPEPTVNNVTTTDTYEDDDDEEEGVYENEPEKRDDVVRESDRDVSKDLPSAGTASSMRARFLQGVEEATSPTTPQRKREITPPAHGAGGEYVSEPRAVMEQYEAKPDAGVFESPESVERDPEIVSAYDVAEEARPEQGTAKNLAARFKDLEAQNKSNVPSPSRKREITPPSTASGPSEYVSEPRGPGIEQYEVKVDAGVFESEPLVNPDVVHSGELQEEALPERGTAKNLASRYLQMTEESTKSPPSAPQREIIVHTDTVARVEYENEPQRNPEVITSDSQVEEFVPQQGFAKNLASRFKELESTAKSPPQSPGRKEITPPREQNTPVVLESSPAQQNPDVIHSGEALEEMLPEKGTAKNMMQRFKQMESESKANNTPRKKKEFTPPPASNAGVYENTPATFKADYNKPAESGVVENTPAQRDDVVRGDEPPQYEVELPERGAAKNLVSKWRQMESEQAAAAAKSPGSRQKEFTPPRDEPHLATRKSPRTPMSPGNSSDNNGSVHPSELPGQYQPQEVASVYESTPDTQRDDVAREGERDFTADLPKKNTAKKMLARFQSFQEKASKDTSSSPASRQESESSTSETEPDPMMESARLVFEDPAQVGRSKSMRAAVQLEKCGSCDKTVYAMERLEMNKTVYHKACFRCSQCRSVLTPKTFAINNGVIFCTNHYKQLFTTKGNYDEGFGRMQHKKRWSSNPNLADGQENGTSNGHHQEPPQQQRQSAVTASDS